jgi:hypothetical protein
MAYGIPGIKTTPTARLCRGVQCSREGVHACRPKSCSPPSEPQPNEEGQADEQEHSNQSGKPAELVDRLGPFLLLLGSSFTEPPRNESRRSSRWGHIVQCCTLAVEKAVNPPHFGAFSCHLTTSYDAAKERKISENTSVSRIFCWFAKMARTGVRVSPS